jgi:endonuclease/exonuclease/phosphatase family metal-dependent hydrolase
MAFLARLRSRLCVPLGASLCITCMPALFAQQRDAQTTTGPQTFTYDEIVQLYDDDLPPPLTDKLHRLLTTPFVNNDASAAGAQPAKPSLRQVGPVLRAVQWNVERGLEYDAVRLAFTDPKKFAGIMEDKKSKLDEPALQRVRDQIGLLKDADLVVLNEVDWGVNRTLFRNVGKDLAAALNMNYAYGVEFVEVDPITMGIDQRVIVREVKDAYAVPDDSKSELIDRVKEIMKPDPSRYLGLHGTAILSRYPLSGVRLIPFQFQGHDWFASEKKRASGFAKAQGAVGEAVFREQLVRQVRRGGRMMLMADLVSDSLPSGKVTVVATHLEDETAPESRRRQLEELLQEIAPIHNPVILAGDMNTSTHDGVPMSVTRLLKDHFGSGQWWAEQGASAAIKYTTPYGLASSLSTGAIAFVRSIDDPTEKSIPMIGKNPEAKFFSTLENFRFDDGGAFDFSGEPGRSSNGKAGKLANSNERHEKGFVPTEELGKKFGPIGEYKLDWIFVKPAKLSDSPDSDKSYAFTPCFGRTLTELNHSIPDRISDHNPIMVDLPLGNRSAATASISAP